MLENAHLSEGVAVAKQRVTIADVAREAGTSTASVSYYLNDKREKLSEKTQAKIARVIKELGYVPNAQAQTLTGKQTHVIAIIILDNTNKWAGLVLNGMEQVMLPAGYQTVVCTSNFNPETELMYVDKMLSRGGDGFINHPTANFNAVHDRIRRAGKPVVFFDAAIYSPGTSWIKTNLYDGVYNATQALLDAGYEDFFSIAANMTEMRTRMERFQGYAEALAANGQLYKAIPIDHNKPSINELTEYFKFKFNPAKRTLIFVQNQWALPRVYKALQPMAHLRNGQGGSVGSKNRLRLAQLIQPAEQLLLGTHLLRDALDHQIGVRSGGFLFHQNIGHQGILGTLGHLALGYPLLQRCVQLLFMPLGGGDAAGVHQGSVAVGGEDLSNAAAHSAGAENCNLHCVSS